MSHDHGLKHQNLLVDAVALGTLGARTAIALNAVMTSATATFLIKRVRFLLQLVGRTLTDDGPVVVFLNKGDASLTELAVAFTDVNTSGPGDTTQVLSSDVPWSVYQDSVRAFVMGGDGTEGIMHSGWIKMPGKGLPASEGSGLAVHALNTGSGALTTGSSINGIVQVQGVWLRD